MTARKSEGLADQRVWWGECQRKDADNCLQRVPSGWQNERTSGRWRRRVEYKEGEETKR
jgi:hypothetical protein